MVGAVGGAEAGGEKGPDARRRGRGSPRRTFRTLRACRALADVADGPLSPSAGRVSEAPPARPRPRPPGRRAAASGSRARRRASSRPALHPSRRGQPPVRDDPGRREGAALVVGREPDPQVPVFLAQGEASEEPRPHEVAPAPEHRRDPHARPAAHRLVQLARGARPSALEVPPRLAAGPQTPHTGGRAGLRCLPSPRLHTPITTGSPRAEVHRSARQGK